MLLLKLWNYFRGYVIIAVEGYFLEKFINICIHRQIFLWDIKKRKDRTMVLKVSIKGFKLLRPVSRKSKCRVRILRKQGLPFIKRKYRKRKAFVLGAALFIIIFYSLTSFIWTIEIKGNKKIDSGLILEKLAQEGIKPGTVKYRIDTKRVASDLMLDIRELAWVGVTVKGTKVKIEVNERVIPPTLVPKDKPCNIIAARDGIIKSVVSKAGFDMVKAGDTVVKGQLLVTGVVPGRDEKSEKTLVHAVSTVKARTWYEAECPVNLKPVVKERTGNKQDRYSLVLFNKKINLSFGKVSFENYDKIEIKKRLTIGEDLVFPFELNIDRYYENNIVENEISLDEAKNIASDQAYKDASQDIQESAEIVKSDVVFIEKDEGAQIIARVTIECIEDIGISEEIGGN